MTLLVKYTIAIVLIFLALWGWLLVQHLVRRNALRHPEWGPPREEGEGCSGHCACLAGRCERELSDPAP